MDFIGSVETGESNLDKSYQVLYGRNEKKYTRPITEYNLDEIISFGPNWTKRHGSSAAGRYQFMNQTLKDLKAELKLTGREQFNGTLQDRLGFHLLRRRGYDRWLKGEQTDQGFGLNLAKEWASMPVLFPVQGRHRTLSRGQSYYAGDKLNKSLVKPEQLESALARAKAKAKDEPALPHPPALDTKELPAEIVSLWQAFLAAWNRYRKG